MIAWGNTYAFWFRSTFDPEHTRGYIDKFLVEQTEQRGKYFTDKDLVINCQVRDYKSC